jgi:hypothetical protein
MRNAWHFCRLGNNTVRIHPPSTDVPIRPGGAPNHLATIEVINDVAQNCKTADESATQAIVQIFGSIVN